MTLISEEVITRVEALVPSLAKRAPEAETLRQLPEATIADIEAADLFRIIVPTSLGGHGLDLPTLHQAARIMAHGCVSTAWTASFLMMHNWLISRFPVEAHDEFFGGPNPWTLTATPIAPTGTYEQVDGGYVVTGRWDWATGVQHADWVIVHAVKPKPTFETRFFAVPVEESEIEDIWHTSGMRGTGSNAVRLSDHFIPERRSVAAQDFVQSTNPIEGDGLAGLPMAPVLALMAAGPALGGAERAVELFRQRVSERVLAYSLAERAVEQPAAQMRLGAAMSQLAGARLQWDTALAELDSHVGGPPLSLDRRAALRLVAADTVRRSRSIINSIAAGSGASIYFSDSPFQRIQRDVEVLKGHVIFDWDRTTELAGKIALGIEPGPADML